MTLMEWFGFLLTVLALYGAWHTFLSIGEWLLGYPWRWPWD